MPIEAGFLGLVKVNGTEFRCNSMSSSPTQTVLPYTHIYGLNDFGTGSTTKGEEVGSVQPQKTIWRPSMTLITGSFDFPADEDNLGTMFEYIKTGNYITTIEFQYTCGTGVTFTNCRLNQYTFRVTAGDILNISVGFTATDVQNSSGSGAYEESKKFITWDKVDIIVDEISTEIQSVDFSVTNEIIPIYTADGTEFGGGLFGLRDMRLGTQNVTGTISTYIKPIEYLLDETSISSVINITVDPGLAIEIKAVLTPLQVSTSTGLFSAGVAFTGVGYALGQ